MAGDGALRLPAPPSPCGRWGRCSAAGDLRPLIDSLTASSAFSELLRLRAAFQALKDVGMLDVRSCF